MIRIIMCGPSAISGGVATHTRNLKESLELREVKIIPINIYGNTIEIAYKRTLGLIFALIINKNEYDIIHIQSSGGIFSFLSAISGILSSKLIKKRIVVTFHYSQTESFVRKHNYLFNWVLKNVNAFILVSNIQKKAILKVCYKYENKIHVIPNGFRENIFFPRDPIKCRNYLEIPLDKKIIFNISNLIEPKGHKYLIMTMREIIYQNKDILCYIAGQGYLKNYLEDLINNLKIDKNVKLLGWIKEEDIPLWINACDIFVLPSLAEGNPIVMFETIGCGKPFVGTNVGGISEIITEENGLICKSVEIEDLKNCIFKAINTTWNHDKIAQSAQQYTWNSIAENLILIYSSILN